jgi:hypothetical protein
MGMLRRPPVCDTASITVFLERMGGRGRDGINVDVDADTSGNHDKAVAERWVWLCTNTAPTAAYMVSAQSRFQVLR